MFCSQSYRLGLKIMSIVSGIVLYVTIPFICAMMIMFTLTGAISFMHSLNDDDDRKKLNRQQHHHSVSNRYMNYTPSQMILPEIIDYQSDKDEEWMMHIAGLTGQNVYVILRVLQSLSDGIAIVCSEARSMMIKAEKESGLRINNWKCREKMRRRVFYNHQQRIEWCNVVEISSLINQKAPITLFRLSDGSYMIIQVEDGQLVQFNIDEHRTFILLMILIVLNKK